MAKNPITVLSEGNKLLDELSKKLVGVNTNLLEISKSARGADLKQYFDVKSPTDVNEKLKLQKTIIEQLNAQVKERNRLETALNNQLAKNKLVESELNKELVKQRFETQQRNKTVKETAILSSKLSTEYQKLVVRMNQAGRAVQNLTAKQAQGINLSNAEQRELKQSQAEFKKYQAAVLKADVSIGRFQRNVGNYSSALGKAGTALRTFVGAFGVFSAVTIGREIFELTKEIDGLDKALLQVTETQEGFNQAQSFITSLAEEAGVNINGLQGAYTKFFAAAKTTNLTLQETQDIFRQTAKAGAVLGLSTDDINGSMKALEQILSKGKVQAEEIRGQLGERLPGAFQILARSMGLTTAQLSKQLELGNVLSDEVLPGFARELEKTYNLNAVKRVETLTAAQNRLGNSWNDFVRSLDGSEGTLTKIFTFVIDGLTSIIDAFSLINTSLEDFNKNLGDDAVTSQIEYYKELGDEASAYAKIDKENAIERIENLKKQKAEQEKVLEKYKDYNAFQKLIRPDARNAANEIERLNNSLATQEGLLRAAKIQLGEITPEIAKNTEATKDNNEQKNKGIEALKGSIAYQTALISALENEQSKLATNTRQYGLYAEEIKKAKQELQDLKTEFQGLDVKGLGTGSEEEAVKSIFKNLKKGVNVSGANSEIDAFVSAEKRKREEAEKTAEILKDANDQIRDNALAAFNESVNFVNALFDAKIQKYDDEINKNNDYYAALLDNEQLSEEQRSALEAERDRKNLELEKKKREEQKKAAILNKVAGIAEVAINTAIAVSKVTAQTGVIAPLLIPSIIALGALQAATIAAQPIPQYKDGKEKGKGKDSWALLNDGGKDELKISASGEMERIKGRNVLGYVKKSDTIIPDADKFISSLTDEQLYNDIHRHSIMASLQGQSDTINNYLMAKTINSQTDRLVKAMAQNKANVKVYNNNSISEDLAFQLKLSRL